MKNRYPQLKQCVLLAALVTAFSLPTTQASITRDGQPQPQPSGETGQERGGQKANKPAATTTKEKDSQEKPELLKTKEEQKILLGQERGGGPGDVAEVYEMFRDLGNSFTEFRAIVVEGHIKNRLVKKEFDGNTFKKIVNNDKFTVSSADERIQTENYETGAPETADFASLIDGFDTTFAWPSWRSFLPWTRQRMVLHELCVLAGIPDPKFNTSQLLQGWLLQNVGHSVKSGGVSFKAGIASISLVQTNPKSLLTRLKNQLRDISKSTSAITIQEKPLFSDLTVSAYMQQQAAEKQDQQTVTYKVEDFKFRIEPYEATLGMKDAIRIHIEIPASNLKSFNISKSMGSYDSVSFIGKSAERFYTLLKQVGEQETAQFAQKGSKTVKASDTVEFTQGLSSNNKDFKYQISCKNLRSGPDSGYTCSLIFSN